MILQILHGLDLCTVDLYSCTVHCSGSQTLPAPAPAFMQNCIKIVCRTWLSSRSSIGEASSGWTVSRSPSAWCPGQPPSGPVWHSVWCSHYWADWWSWAHWCWVTTWCTPSSTPSSTAMRVTRISVVTNYSNYPTIQICSWDQKILFNIFICSIFNSEYCIVWTRPGGR